MVKNDKMNNTMIINPILRIEQQQKIKYFKDRQKCSLFVMF